MGFFTNSFAIFVDLFLLITLYLTDIILIQFNTTIITKMYCYFFDL